MGWRSTKMNELEIIKKLTLMKRKLPALLFALFLFTNNISAQQSASGTTNFASNVCCFNGFAWTIQYNFNYNDNNAKGLRLDIISKSISVANYKWQTQGQQFSPSDLAFSSWPVQSESATLFGVVTIYYKSNLVKTFNSMQIVNSIDLGTFNQWSAGGTDGPYLGLGSLRLKLSDFNINDFTVKFTNVSNGGVSPGNEQIYKAYEAKTATPKTNESNTTLEINGQSSSSSTPTETPENTSGNNGNPLPNYNAPSTSNDATIQALTAASSLISQWGAQVQAKQEAEMQLRIQREEEEARIQEEQDALEAKRQELIMNRKKLILKFPDGKTPLTHEVKDSTKVYYFTYSYQPSTIEYNTATIYISNVFPLVKYSDGSWPSKANLLEDIAKRNTGLNLILSGYYLNKADAEYQRQTLVSGVKNYSFVVQSINYAGKKTEQTGDASTDFWGNPTNVKVEEPATQSTPSSATPNTANPSNTEVDFWGNPIK